MIALLQGINLILPFSLFYFIYFLFFHDKDFAITESFYSKSFTKGPPSNERSFIIEIFK